MWKFSYLAQDRKSWDQNTMPYSYNWSQEIFIVYVPINSFTHYPTFYTIRLYYQAPTYTLTPSCRSKRQFLWWSLVWPSQGMNPQPTTWDADSQTTMPSHMGPYYVFDVFQCCILSSYLKECRCFFTGLVELAWCSGSAMDGQATAWGSIPGRNGVFTELHVLRKNSAISK